MTRFLAPLFLVFVLVPAASAAALVKKRGPEEAVAAKSHRAVDAPQVGKHWLLAANGRWRLGFGRP